MDGGAVFHAVSQGLGRTGPWLQNASLRVETRLEDGSISVVAIAGGFRPAERALAFVDTAHGRLTFGRCEYDVRPYDDRLGRGRIVAMHFRDRRGFILRRETVLYDAHPFAVTRVGVTNESTRPARIDALHAFTTPAGGRGRLQMSTRPVDLRVYRHGWQSWAPTMSLSGAALDLRSAPTILAPEPPAAEPGRFNSDDVGVLHDPAAGRSLLVGAITARDFISQVYVDAPARHIDARSLADGIALDPGTTLWSERNLVDIVGTPQEQLERYGEALGTEMGARVPSTTPSGWCSWYYFYTQVTEDDVVRNLRELERLRATLHLDTVQIDDGYQADVGDWLTVNEKFPHGMQWLAKQISDAGFTAGIWLAPFLLAESSRTFAEHPDWVVRDEAGAPIAAQHNWERANYGLDGSHPAARAWLSDLFREVCDGWGYDYVKIDFLFAAAIAGRRHDPVATRVRAYRQALAAVREGVGEQRFILGCGALMAPSVGFFDGNRIGQDTAPFWRFLSREDRASGHIPPRGPDDNLSAEASTRNVINRWWTHRRLWANDPDCLMVRDTRTKLIPPEIATAASVIGLSGGMTLFSDDLPLLHEDRIRAASLFVPPLPAGGSPPDLTSTDMPERFDYVDDRPFDPVRLAGVFNFSDETRDLELDLPPGVWHVFDVWRAAPFGTASGVLSLPGLPAHGCRIFALRPALDRPQLAATDAHFGAGIVDVSSVGWDGASGVLDLTLAPAGRTDRSIWLATAGRRASSARFEGAHVTVEPAGDGLVCLSLSVTQTATLQVEFEGARG